MADLFDIVVARKLSGGGGGGGSSDFSTAEVTVNTPSVRVQIPYIINEEQGGTVFDGGIANSGTYTVPLYKGMLVADYSSISHRTITVTGNIMANEPMFVITGNGTITIS